MAYIDKQVGEVCNKHGKVGVYKYYDGTMNLDVLDEWDAVSLQLSKSEARKLMKILQQAIQTKRKGKI